MPAPIRYRAIAIDPDSGGRTRLKTSTQSVVQFQSIEFYSSLVEGLCTIRESEKLFDVVFLSERLPREDLKGFIEDTRKLTPTQDAAYVLLLPPNESQAAKTAQSVLIGFDGCLMEPYSVTSLLDITKLAARVKKKRSDARERVAIQFLVKDIIKHVDRLAYIRACRMDVGPTLKRLKEACSVFGTLDERCVGLYYDSACDLFEGAPCNSLDEKTAYKGVSNRIKQRMVKRLIDQEDAAEKKY